MPLTREESRKELVALDLPAAVLAVFDARLPHPALRDLCEDPYHIFSTPIEPGDVHITPLWESGIAVTAYQHMKPKGRFIHFSLERPQDIRVFGTSFQSVAAALLIFLWENEQPEKDLRALAELFEFRHLDRLLRECESRSKSESNDNYKEWHARFLEFCDTTA